MSFRILLKFVIVVFLAIGSSGCFTNRNKKLESDVEILKARVKLLEGSIYRKSRLSEKDGRLRLKIYTDIYDSSMQLFETKKYDKAKAGFSQIVTEAPELILSADARFMLAESEFAQKEFRISYTDYQTLINDWPNYDRLPTAILKSGEIMLKLKEVAAADHHFNALVSKFPDSKEAEKARNYLTDNNELDTY